MLSFLPAVVSASTVTLFATLTTTVVVRRLDVLVIVFTNDDVSSGAGGRLARRCWSLFVGGRFVR